MALYYFAVAQQLLCQNRCQLIKTELCAIHNPLAALMQMLQENAHLLHSYCLCAAAAAAAKCVSQQLKTLLLNDAQKDGVFH